jgi:hypothetical protein
MISRRRDGRPKSLVKTRTLKFDLAVERSAGRQDALERTMRVQDTAIPPRVSSALPFRGWPGIPARGRCDKRADQLTDPAARLEGRYALASVGPSMNLIV